MQTKGFTIIELVITIFILSFAVVGIFAAFSVMATLTYDATDRLTAAYLGQEGIEIVRNIRDTNWLGMDALSGGSWTDGLTSSAVNNNINCDTSSPCQADYLSTQMAYMGDVYLRINSDGFYNYTDGTATKFKRDITITPLTDFGEKADHIIKVTVKVSWDQKKTIFGDGHEASPTDCHPANCVKIIVTLYDWYNYFISDEGL